MISLKTIEDFLNNRDIAVIGASTNKKKFGYIVFEALQKKRFNVFPVNPGKETIIGVKCYPDIFALPDHVKAAVFITKPGISLSIVKQICKRGVITYLWFQQGSEKKEAIILAEQNGIEVVQGECILMFIKPSGFPHGIHRLINNIRGKYPK
jgi:predicted CoA-binding protein